MRVVASDEVRAYVEANGGVLYVNARRHKCCSGALTLLETSTAEPEDPADYRAFDAGGFPLRLRTGSPDEPDELVVEMKGLRRRHPVAYWNGCAFKI
ncbi:MAG: hypothetical protein ABSD97_07540 [Acidimicrobiales bacterium]|jgi:hypothetical protein